jgi:hypothetical protein
MEEGRGVEIVGEDAGVGMISFINEVANFSFKL